MPKKSNVLPLSTKISPEVEDYPGREELIRQYGRRTVEDGEAALKHAREKYLRSQEPHHQKLFPGDPERARRLGRIYEELQARILGFLVGADEQDRVQMIRALQARIAAFPRGRTAPSKAPRLWAERDTESGINPAEFTRKHYARWIDAGLTRKDLKLLDPPLYNALSVWEHRHPDQRLTELRTATEVIDEKIAALSAEFSEDELRKLGTTLQSRLRRSAR